MRTEEAGTENVCSGGQGCGGVRRPPTSPAHRRDAAVVPWLATQAGGGGQRALRPRHSTRYIPIVFRFVVREWAWLIFFFPPWNMVVC